MHVPYLDLGLIHSRIQKELDEAYHMVMDRQWFIGGKADEQFEEAFAAYCGAAYCVGTGNGLDAIRLILLAYGIGQGDEVIVPANTFIGWMRQRPLSPQRKFSVPSVFLTRQPEKAKRSFTLKKWRNAPTDACGTIRFLGRSMRLSTLPTRRCMRRNRKMWV